MDNQTINLIYLLVGMFLIALFWGISFLIALYKQTTLFDLWLGLIIGVLKFLSAVFNGIEKSLIDLICVVVPYATPLVPAYLTFDNAQTILGLPAWVAWTVAFVFEALGLASVATAVRFWRHNKKNENKAQANQAPFSAVRNIYIAYLVVVVLVNVVLEWQAGTRSFWDILTIAALSLLSYPAASLVAYRQIHSDILEEKAIAKATKNVGNENQGGGNNQQKQQRPKPASHYRDKITAMLEAEFKASGKILTPKQITTALKLEHSNNKGFVSTLTSDWKKANNIMGFDTSKDE